MDHSGDHDFHSHHHHQEILSEEAATMSPVAAISAEAMDHSMHGMGHMAMSFHWGYDEVILFNQWKISTPSGLLASMLGIFFLAALYEGIKYYREYLFWKTYNDLHYRSIPAQNQGGSIEENKDTAKVVPVCEVLQKQPASMLMMSAPHFIQTLLHVVQITMSFLLMLVFMTYNIGLCIAVVAGAACGYFLFGWKKSVIVDVTEHCH